jgi:hypothetical protein
VLKPTAQSPYLNEHNEGVEKVSSAHRALTQLEDQAEGQQLAQTCAQPAILGARKLPFADCAHPNHLGDRIAAILQVGLPPSTVVVNSRPDGLTLDIRQHSTLSTPD